MTPTARYRRFWLLFYGLVVTPILIGIPILATAVAQAILIVAALMAFEYVRLVRPGKLGLVAIVRGAVVVLFSVTVLVFSVAALYVARHGAAVEFHDALWHSAVGVVYIVVAFGLARGLTRRWWPVTTPSDLRV